MGRPKKTDKPETPNVEGEEILDEQTAPEVEEFPNEEETPEVEEFPNEEETPEVEEQPIKESKSEENLPANVVEKMRLYPQYEELWITPRGFVHPIGVPQYLLKGAKRYKNRFYNK